LSKLCTLFDTPAEPDLLSINIDGNDYHVWNAIKSFRPRVVIVECNAKFVSPVIWIMPYDPNYRWNQTDRHGASLQALAQLAESKGYSLVGCNITGTNAFFVRRDQVGDHFAQASDHRHPLRLDRIPGIASCHPAGVFTPSGWPEA
jgi:hypothetical protein